MEWVFFPQVVVVRPGKKDPIAVTKHDVGGVTTVTVEKTSGNPSEEDRHCSVRQTQFQSADLEHEMSPVHVVDDHEEPKIETYLRSLVISSRRHKDQVSSITCSRVQQRPDGSVHRTMWPPKAFHTHQPIFAVRGLFQRVVLDEAEKMRHETRQHDVSELVRTDAAIGKSRATHDYEQKKRKKN